MLALLVKQYDMSSEHESRLFLGATETADVDVDPLQWLVGEFRTLSKNVKARTSRGVGTGYVNV